MTLKLRFEVDVHVINSVFLNSSHEICRNETYQSTFTNDTVKDRATCRNYLL